MSLIYRLLGLVLVPCRACGGTGWIVEQRAVAGRDAHHPCYRCHGRGWKVGRR